MAYDQKTKPMAITPEGFIAALDHPTRQRDAKRLLHLYSDITGLDPVMWGPSIIGYGRYDYVYDSGHAGTSFMAGFSPRKARLVLYILPGYRDLSEQLQRLGKHKVGKACLYINKLADIDLDVLTGLIGDGFREMVHRYGETPHGSA